MTDAPIQPGDHVRVREMATHDLHIRTPVYLRGKPGVVERDLGTFKNPEVNAYYGQPDMRQLLRVRFRLSDLWDTGDGPSHDTLDAEIFAHWLDKADHADAP